MKTLLMRNAFRLCLAATCLSVPLAAQQRPVQGVCDPALEQYRYESDRAKGIAAVEVGGDAIAARRIDLNGATGGWEVLVRKGNASQGWRVVVDRDTWTVRSKDQIPNP